MSNVDLVMGDRKFEQYLAKLAKKKEKAAAANQTKEAK